MIKIKYIFFILILTFSNKGNTFGGIDVPKLPGVPGRWWRWKWWIKC